jgi:hypothetical protein
MHITDEPLTEDQSPLDAVTVDFIDSEELTDTAALPEPIGEVLADRITHAIEDVTARVTRKD